jgi:hypothetical protein
MSRSRARHPQGLRKLQVVNQGLLAGSPLGVTSQISPHARRAQDLVDRRAVSHTATLAMRVIENQRPS